MYLDRRKLKRRLKVKPIDGQEGRIEKHQKEEKTKRIFGKHLSRNDFQDIMKVLKIKLPKGVLKSEVVNHSRHKTVIKDAKAIITDLENFQLQFAKIPRLACREVKTALPQEMSQVNILRITRMIFFMKPKSSNEILEQQWKNNKSRTVCGFRMKRTYQMKRICTPEMTEPKSLRNKQHVEKNQAFITDGRKVTVEDLLQSYIKPLLSGHHFGNHSYYQDIEMLCLRFFHQERLNEYKSPHDQVSYSKGNKVEFGFLSGRLDFLATICAKTGSAIQKTIIECKGTKGDMVGKAFIKPVTGHRAELNKKHEYYYQTLAYRYILKNVESNPIAVRAVMVLRHENKDNPEFYWKDVEESSEQIDKLRRLCEEEALPRFLAILNLIFKKENKPNKRHVKLNKRQTFLKK